MNFYQQPWSSNLISWQWEVGMATRIYSAWQGLILPLPSAMYILALLYHYSLITQNSMDTDHRVLKRLSHYTKAEVILEGDLGEKVFLSWLTSPYLELREKWKCIDCIGKSKIWTKTPPWNPEIVAKLLPLWKLWDDPCKAQKSMTACTFIQKK